MAKPDKPLDYQRRIRDTKGIAQRLDLSYLRRPALLLALRHRLTWALVAMAALAAVPLVMGTGGIHRTLENGPLSESHALFEQRCDLCHAAAFSSVPDRACIGCHESGPHPAKPIDRTVHLTEQRSCADCHVEHRGKVRLASVGNRNCTSCHADIKAHEATAKVSNVAAFRPGRHPEFSTAGARDARPLLLNHAKHMPAEARVIRGMKLPMKCGDCHAADPNSPTGSLLPVTFEANCKSCHARELEFDVDHVLGDRSVPAPHAKDAAVIRQFIQSTLAGALKADPARARRPVGNDLVAQPDAAHWIARVVQDSENYLFGRKCGYCHQTDGQGEVRKVNRILGRFADGRPEGEPWFPRGEFSHRAHRAVACEGCHAQARTSTQTSDVLIPPMKSCTPCHGGSTADLDDCAKCHRYHNRALEKDRPSGGPFASPAEVTQTGGGR